MGREKFGFESIESVEGRIRRLVHDAAYVQVWDRTDRNNELNLGRFDLTESDALPYLSEAASSPHLEEDFDEEGPSELYEEEDAPHQRGRYGEPVSPEAIGDAACRWLREMAVSNTVGEAWCRFRVRVYGPKGIKVLHTGTFICRNHDHDLELPVPAALQDLKIPLPTFEEAATAGAAKGIKALGDYYAQWGRIVLGSVGQLQGVNNEMLARLHKQLGESREQVDQLVGAILENRVSELQVDEQRRSEERAGDARHALAKEALTQLGDAAKTFVTARGLHPEMADMLGVLGTSPDLMAALNDPEVRSLMQDPSNLASLAHMLKVAAQQARAAREAASTPPGPPPTEG